MLKKLSLLITLICSLQAVAFAQKADDILGKWVSASGEGQIQIYKKGSQYFGKLAWMKAPNDETTGKPKTDIHNPDASLHQRPLLGLELLKSFTFGGDDTYEDGTIYDPRSGKTYSCKMTLNNNKLKIRGYIGVSLLGRTETWTRLK